MTMKNKWIKKFILELKSLKKFDIIWLILCTIGITITSIKTNNSPLAIIASIMGVIYVILNGCRLSIAFLFGIINTLIWGFYDECFLFMSMLCDRTYSMV